MKTMMKVLMVLALGAIICLPGVALGDTTTVIVDENGNGSYNSAPLSAGLALDPGPGGLSSALTYTLPFAVTPGDVLMTEDVAPPSDLVRFNPPDAAVSTLVFYSDQDPNGLIDSLADTGLPSTFYSNIKVIQEVQNPDGTYGAIYTPGSGDPGYVSGSSITYEFISDVPLPPSVLLLGSGLLGLVGLGWRRRRG